MKTYKYRLYPTKKQVTKLSNTLEACRELYNCALLQRKIAYRQFKVSLRRLDQQGELLEIKECYPEYQQIHSQVLQEVILRVDKSFQNFFRKVRLGEKPGYPRYKGQGWYDSFTYPQSGFSLSGNSKGNQRLKLSKIGQIKVKLHRSIQGKIKNCTIKRERNHWYICFSCEVEPVILPKTGNSVGVDVGIEKFAALSDGTIIENPKFLRESEAKLKHEQRCLSRKKKGSRSRKKQRNRVARLYCKIRNQRNDFLHKESLRLVETYDVIVFEDLKIRNMIKNRHLAKSILDAAWGAFMQFTSYKAENAGREVRFAYPHGSSQDCSGCGRPVKKSLAVRVHKCPYCGLILDRDINAAINILRRGTRPGGATALAG